MEGFLVLVGLGFWVKWVVLGGDGSVTERWGFEGMGSVWVKSVEE